MTDEEAINVGNVIIQLFGLKVDKKTARVNTTWGDKTILGIGRCVERIVDENTIAEQVDQVNA